MANLTVELLTPEATVWSGEARALVARSREGFFTVLAQHADMDTDLVPGLVRLDGSEGEVAVVVHGGFVRVSKAQGATTATVLASVAEKVSDIDVGRAQQARSAAESALQAAGDDPYAVAEATAALARAELRLELASASAR